MRSSTSSLIDWAGVVGIHKSNATITGNTFLANSINYISDSPHNYVIETVFVQDNLFYQEDGGGQYAIYVNDFAPVYDTLSHNCFFGGFGSYFSQSILPGLLDTVYQNYNGDNCDLYFNIYRDPLFCSEATGDFSLWDISQRY